MGRTSDANQRLMDAALALMWEESYGSVTIDDICKRADVKKGSFYYFFKSKSELAVAALKKLWNEQWKPALDTCFSSSTEPLERLRNYFDAIYAMQVEIKAQHGRILGCPVCSVGSEISTLETEVCATIRDIVARKQLYYQSALRDAVAQGEIEPCDPVEMSLAVTGLIEGIVTQARIMNDPELLRRLPAMALGMLRVRSRAEAAQKTPVLA